MKPFVVILALLLAQAMRAGVTNGVEYGRVEGEGLTLDVSVPDGAGPFAAVIIVHGGGWTSDDTAANCVPLFAPLSRAGFVWFAVKYRLAPAHRWPACVEDVETAIRWVKAHAAEYRVDPQRIALLGESAGGQVVQMAAVRAMEATRLAALVAFYSPCDNVADSVRRGGPSKSMQALLGVGEKLDAAAEGKLQAVSPLNFVNSRLPPCLLIHGTADQSVPYDQSLQWQARLRAHGIACELITVPNAPHGMGKWETMPGIDLSYKTKLVEWLAKTLDAGK
jgi:acetyl esterase